MLDVKILLANSPRMGAILLQKGVGHPMLLVDAHNFCATLWHE